MAEPTRLCTKCAQINLPTNASERDPRPHHQTVLELSAAVNQDGCFICKKMWGQLDIPEDFATNTEMLWIPITYRVYQDLTRHDIFNLDVYYEDFSTPPKEIEIASFRILPTGPGYEVERLESNEESLCTSSPSSLATAHTWLQACNEAHASCNRLRTVDGNSFPTRVLDIGSDTTPTWKLCIAAEDGLQNSHEPYITLTYRRGSQYSLRLLSATVDDFRHGNHLISDMPQTFKDFVRVARPLRIRYLWIDALCIIQDSAQDWSIEALKMRSIYGNSTCNIAAAASSDENGGLFRNRNAQLLKLELVTLSQSSGEPQVCRIYEREYWNEQLSKSPLHGRGWAFLERHLSPRIVYFGHDQLLWECFESAKCEAFPRGVPHYFPERPLDELFKLQQSLQVIEGYSSGTSRMSHEAYGIWCDLVEKYAQCSFTKAEDKSVAFAGIAEVFHKVTGDQYLAGLWRSRLAEGLDWRVHEPWERTPGDYRAPSWSWLSVDGPLQSQVQTSASEYLIEVVHAEMVLAELGPMSRALSGYLTVNVFLLEAWCLSMGMGGTVILQIESTASEAWLYPDHAGVKLFESKPKFLAPVHSYLAFCPGITEAIPHVAFVWLERIGNGYQGSYRRVGHIVVDRLRCLEELGFERNVNGVMIPPSGSLTRIVIE